MIRLGLNRRALGYQLSKQGANTHIAGPAEVMESNSTMAVQDDQARRSLQAKLLHGARNCLTGLRTVNADRERNPVLTHKDLECLGPHDCVVLKHTVQPQNHHVLLGKRVVDRSGLWNAVGHAAWAQRKRPAAAS